VPSRRAPALQELLDNLVRDLDIGQDFLIASDHKYGCTCQKCLAWWADIGPDGEPDDQCAFGPFSREQVESYCREVGKPITWGQSEGL